MIYARGIVSCDLISKKDFIDDYGEQIKKGDLIATIKDKNESGSFKKEMTPYIKDDNDLSNIFDLKLWELTDKTTKKNAEKIYQALKQDYNEIFVSHRRHLLSGLRH